MTEKIPRVLRDGPGPEPATPSPTKAEPVDGSGADGSSPPLNLGKASGRGELLTSPTFFSYVLPLWDYVTFLVLLYLFYGFRQTWSPVVFFEPGRFISHSIFILCIIGAIALTGGYRAYGTTRRLSAAAELLLAVGVGAVVGFFIVYTVLTRSLLFAVESRAAITLATLAFLVPCIGIRTFLSVYREHVAKGHPYVLVGVADDIRDFLRNYSGTGLQNPLIVACISHDTFSTDEKVIACLDLEDIDWHKLHGVAQAVIVCTDLKALPPDLVEQLVRVHFREVQVLSLSAFYESMWRKVPTLHLDYSWALHSDFDLAERSNYAMVKRAFDLVLSPILILFSLPFLLVAAVAIKVHDGGPIFFRQVRVGRGRRPFLIYKFRTMRVHADAESPYTAKEDDRITPIGKWLRLSRLDELPQLLNVLRGEMSLIGPRAEWVRLVEEYEQKIPCYHLRHLVKPGITGWAQLNYPYGSSLDDAVEKLKYDLYYIDHYTPVLDLEIVLKTALSLLSLKGR